MDLQVFSFALAVILGTICYALIRWTERTVDAAQSS